MTTNNKNETVTGLLAEGQRWSADRKRKVVLRLLRGANQWMRFRGEEKKRG